MVGLGVRLVTATAEHRRPSRATTQHISAQATSTKSNEGQEDRPRVSVLESLDNLMNSREDEHLDDRIHSQVDEHNQKQQSAPGPRDVDVVTDERHTVWRRGEQHGCVAGQHDQSPERKTPVEHEALLPRLADAEQHTLPHRTTN